MPNWCANVVVIEATELEGAQKLRQLENHLNDEGGLFEFFIPIPEELNNPLTGRFGGEDAEAIDALREELKEKYGFSGWYDFCIAKWGSKWDARIDDFYRDGDEVTIYFDTAWSPPIAFYQTLFEEFNMKVKATFVEQGANYIGYYVDGDYKDQEFVTDPYDEDNDDFSYSECQDQYFEAFLDNCKYKDLLEPNNFGG